LQRHYSILGMNHIIDSKVFNLKKR